MHINPTIELMVGILLFHEQFTEIQGVTFCFVWAAIDVYKRQDNHQYDDYNHLT